jgi:DNA repair exonuclease SbcCD ATPase subunit
MNVAYSPIKPNVMEISNVDFTKLYEKQNQFESKLNKFEINQIRFGDKLDGFEKRMDRFEEKMDRQHSEVLKKFDYQNTRFDLFQQQLLELKVEVKEVEGSLNTKLSETKFALSKWMFGYFVALSLMILGLAFKTNGH